MKLKILQDRHVQFGIALLILALIPLFLTSDSMMHIAIFVLLYIILALGLEVALGITGLFSLCPASFYGMGAYVSALLSIHFGLSFWVTLPIAALCSGLFGMLIGLPALRTNGDYLAIATLGFGEIFRLVLVNGGELTRGPRGLPGIARPELFGLDFSNKMTYYYVILTFAVLIFLVVFNIPRTFFGRALMAIRDDEDAAGFMGIHIARYKVIAFTISGLIAGIAGAFYAHYIWGSGTVAGPVLGAVVLTLLPEFLRDFVEYRMLIYGLIVVIMMQLRPNGILGHLNTRRSYLHSLLKETLGGKKAKGGTTDAAGN